jgi:hypothetical protein
MMHENVNESNFESVMVHVVGEPSPREIPLQKVPTFQLFEAREGDAEEVEKLALDIHAHGQKTPIDITPEGVILAGHRRLAICTSQGKTPLVRILDFKTDTEKQDYILSEGFTGFTWRQMSEIDKGKLLFKLMVAQGVRDPSGKAKKGRGRNSQEPRDGVTEGEWYASHHISSSGYRWVSKYLASLPENKAIADEKKAKKAKVKEEVAATNEAQRKLKVAEHDALLAEVKSLREQVATGATTTSTPHVPVAFGSMEVQEIEKDFTTKVNSLFAELYPGYVMQLAIAVHIPPETDQEKCAA